MKKNSTNHLLLLLIFCLTNVQAQNQIQEVIDGSVNYNWKDGTIKEVSIWDNGITLSRKLYNKKGKIIEEHTYNSNKIVKSGSLTQISGVINTFYETGKVASIVKVKQEWDNEKKINNITAIDTIKGYDRNDGYLLFDFVLSKDLELKQSNINKNLNMYYIDVFLLLSTYQLTGLNGLYIEYNKNHNILSTGSIMNGKKIDLWKSFYFSKKLKAVGKYSHGSISARIGEWTFYFENETISSIINFSEKNVGRKIKKGDKIGIAKYYYESGKLKYKLNYPSYSDFNKRIDTLESYYGNGKLESKYDIKDQLNLIFSGMDKIYKYPYGARIINYSKNGNIVSCGYLHKKPKTKITSEDINVYPCVEKNRNRIGKWYFFDNEDNINSIILYDLCGKIIDVSSSSKLNKENKSYQKSKESYSFENQLEL